MTHPLFHVGEIAIIARTARMEYLGRECTVTGDLMERSGCAADDPISLLFPFRALCYAIRTHDGQDWLCPPQALRKRHEPGMPWAELRDELNKQPRVMEENEFTRIARELGQGESITIEILP